MQPRKQDPRWGSGSLYVSEDWGVNSRAVHGRDVIKSRDAAATATDVSKGGGSRKGRAKHRGNRY